MANASPGITYAQLAWAHTWFLNEETYKTSLATMVAGERLVMDPAGYPAPMDPARYPKPGRYPAAYPAACYVGTTALHGRYVAGKAG